MSDHNSFELLTSTTSSISEKSEKKIIEVVIPKETDNLSSNILIGRKRKKHDKFEGYNVKRKILSHYFKFLTDLINTINRFFFRKEKNKKRIKFSIIRYNLGLEKDIFKLLKEKTIEDLLLNYQNERSKNQNLEVYNLVTKVNVITKILKEKCFNYGFLYKYYNNKKEFSLLKYNNNINIHLNSKTKSFEDLLKSNLSDNVQENEKYKQEMEKCVQKFFFDTYFKI